MMEPIRQLAIVFCAVTVLSGGFQLLTGGALEKSAGYILSLVLLVSVIVAVSRTEFDFEIKKGETAAAAYEYEESLSEYQAEYICKAILSERGIEFEKVYANATKTEDGGIVINEITVKGAENAEAAVKAILDSKITETVTAE